jgi:phage gp37-like protein
MIQTIVEAVITELEKVTGVVTVDQWVGDIEPVIRAPARLPALYAVYSGSKFSGKNIIGSNQADHTMEITVVALARNVRSDVEGSEACYTLIEAVRSKLIGHVITNYGFLWPVAEDLLYSEKGILCYGLRYKIDTKT